ncbi:MAG: SAM-dependent methyltransferase, partial [Alphaproteobacteria bacterium]
MTMSAATPSAAGNPSRVLPWLLLLFAGSGASALVYEIVWYQMLMLTIGANAVSLGVLLATYMGGLSLGSWLLPKFLASRWSDKHPLKVYAYIEIAVAAFALLLLVLMPLIDKMYVGVASPNAGFFGIALRAIACAIALLPPTILMGASLPAIARWAESSRRGASWWGLFYGVNIFGAVVGTMAAGFWLMRYFNIYVGTGVAAGVNILVAGLALVLAMRVPPKVDADNAEDAAEEAIVAPDPAPAALSRWGVLVSIALSGAASMGGQVIWARILGPMLGGTVYVFSIILSVFLIGLGFGAWAGSSIGRRFNGRTALGWSQVLAALGLAWTAYQFSSALPYWPMNPQQNTTFMVTVQSDFVRVLWGILPATLCWGAAVPLAFAAMRGSGDAGKTVGGVYAANTLGAIFGALLVSLIIIPGLSTHTGEKILVAVSVLAAFAAFAPAIFVEGAAGEARKGLIQGWVSLAVATLASLILITT